MAQQAVLVACGGGDANIVAWDLATATQLTLYKGNNSGPGCFCTVGRDYFAAAQANKDAVHFYAYHKDQVLQRSFAQERLTALAASRDGRLLAAGGTSGTLYLWDAPSGTLLRAWPGHYKAVTALAFSETGGILLTGGQDTVAAAWLVADVVDSATAAAGGWGLQGGRVEPLHTWSEHTLGVTAVTLGMGEANAIAVTASLDRTVKIWQLATGALLRATALPAGATSVALDAGEHALYVGCADGSIVEVPLAGGSSSMEATTTAAAAATGSSSASACGPGYIMEGHAKPVTSLALSRDGDAIVSGSEDGTVRLWDLRSRQCTRVINAPGRAPVTGVLAVDWPEYLSGVGAATAAAGGRQGPKCPAPLAPLAKFEGGGAGAAPGGATAARPWEGAPLIIDGSCPLIGVAEVPGLLAPRAAPLMADAGAATSVVDLIASGTAGGSSGGGGDQEVAELRQQLADARSAAERWKQLHGELHAALLAEQARQCCLPLLPTS